MKQRLLDFLHRLAPRVRAAGRRLAQHLLAFAKWLWRGGLPRWLVAAAFLLVLGMYCRNDDMAGAPEAPRGEGQYRPVLARGDGHMMFLMARSTALDLDWDFDNDLKDFGDPWGQPIGPNGHKVIPHPVGPPLVWTPLMWTAHIGSKIVNIFGADIPSHGYTEWHQRFVFLSCVLAACLAIAIAILVAGRILGGRWSPVYAGIAGLLGTSLTYYATYMPSYGHAFDALACAAFLGYWALTLGRVDLKRWVVLGLLLGAAMLIRMQELGLGIVVAIEVVVVTIRALRAPERSFKTVLAPIGGGALVLALALVLFVPQLVYWNVVYGEFFGVPQGGAYTRLDTPMIFELLYSARNGWFSTHPLAYAGVIGLWFLPRRARLVAAGLFAAVALQVYLNSTIFDWWGMASFGQRRLCSMTLPIVIGLAALLWRSGRFVAKWPKVPRIVWHVPALLVLGTFVVWNLNRVGDLASGTPAPAGLQPTCCDKVPERVRDHVTWFYTRFGNPFQFPANAIFAIRHDVSLQRWDQVVGNYPVLPPADVLMEDRLSGQRGRWRLGHPHAEPYLIGRWTGSLSGDRPYRFTLDRTVRALVPNNMPHDQHVTVWLAPGSGKRVTVRWNDNVVFEGDLKPAWNPIGFTLKNPDVGENELTIECELGPFKPSEGWSPFQQPVGVAVGSIDLELL